MGDIELLDRLLAELEEDRRRIERREQVLTALRDSATNSGDEDAERPRGTAAIVAATIAHGFYLRNSAYVCQANRGFNNDELSHIGFYAGQKIQREIPRIVARRQAVVWTQDNADRLRATGDPIDERLTNLIETTLRTREQDLAEGQRHDVFLLTPEGDDETIILPHPIPHHSWKHSGSGYTRKHRYNYIEALLSDPADTNALEAVQHDLEVRRRLAK